LVHGGSHQKEEAIPGSLTSGATCPSEVKKILVKLNPNKSAGVDSIPAHLLKCVANELANPVSWLFNVSFTRAIVPQLWKQANISPIYKDGDTGSVTNYRGIILDNQGQVDVVFLDFSKAFDLVNHSFLVRIVELLCWGATSRTV